MRRKDREITSYDKMLEIMQSCDCCRIGLKDKDGVYILPLNFGYEEKSGKLTLYFHGASEGKKYIYKLWNRYSKLSKSIRFNKTTKYCKF